MDATGHPRAGDGEAILRLLEDPRRDDPGPALPWTLLDGLRALGPLGGCVSYQVLDTRADRVVTARESLPDDGHELWEDDPAAPQDESERAYFDLWWDDPLCSHPERTGRQELTEGRRPPTSTTGGRRRPVDHRSRGNRWSCMTRCGSAWTPRTRWSAARTTRPS